MYLKETTKVIEEAKESLELIRRQSFVYHLYGRPQKNIMVHS